MSAAKIENSPYLPRRAAVSADGQAPWATR